ncbi:DUF1963 domain-containing protein [Goodfellowiella coeruleoviolacea]|uniref:DUF1963 domain-containing protein n=1 Tax=Goodfellowiella coeruleoviolacea TaxID=334858 RepID=A0AAE3KJ39_9PSEU|nr:DUF1963 domain-containing protein [Goodfellowiella coeruleoviolacea]MCP2168637.1 protein of unknown function (DUF1963) [Goodfellowiella coeruleoviolacea]
MNDATDLVAEIERHCAEVLGQHGGRNMAALARRGHLIVPADAGEQGTGRCRLGGAALLEPGTRWPEVDGIPLSLLAVLDVDALACWLGAELPASPGLLNFFHIQPYLDHEQYDGVNPFTDPRSWRVIAARPEHAVETPAPAGHLTRAGEVLLRQLTSDDEFEWGDGGQLYYLISAEALRAGDFSRVRVHRGE